MKNVIVLAILVASASTLTAETNYTSCLENCENLDRSTPEGERQYRACRRRCSIESDKPRGVGGLVKSTGKAAEDVVTGAGRAVKDVGEGIGGLFR